MIEMKQQRNVVIKRPRESNAVAQDQKKLQKVGYALMYTDIHDWLKQYIEEHVQEEEIETSIWSKPVESSEEKSKEEEYEDYFADLLQ